MCLPCGVAEILGARRRVGRHGDGTSFLGGDGSQCVPLKTGSVSITTAVVTLPLLVPCPQGLETLLQNSHLYRGLILVVPTLQLLRRDLHTFSGGSQFLPSRSLFLSAPSHSFSPPRHYLSLVYLLSVQNTLNHGFLVGEVAHASALLTLQEWEWLCWKVLERRPLDTKELGHFLSRKASLTSYGLASVSDSSGNLI